MACLVARLPSVASLLFKRLYLLSVNSPSGVDGLADAFFRVDFLELPVHFRDFARFDSYLFDLIEKLLFRGEVPDTLLVDDQADLFEVFRGIADRLERGRL